MEKYIYHYTSIKTLALMFSNKTLRLNSLSNVDDMEEGQVNWFGDLSKYVFVSSWTKDNFENIALWNMYTPNMVGIRIGIDPKKVVVIKNNNNSIHNIRSNKTILAFQNDNFLIDVVYTRDPTINLIDEISSNISRKEIAQIGKIKNMLWKFQNEVRFILMALPSNKVLYTTSYLSLENRFFETILHHGNSNINYIDLKLDDNVWENAEILLGPNTDLGDERIVRSLIKTYYPHFNINLKKSSLRIRNKQHN